MEIFCWIVTKKEKIKVFFRKIWKFSEKDGIIQNAETKRFTLKQIWCFSLYMYFSVYVEV